MSSSTVHVARVAALATLCLALGWTATPQGVATAQQAKPLRVTIDRGSGYRSTKDALGVTVAARLAKPTQRLRVRLTITDTQGRTVYQRTEVMTEAAAGSRRIRFAGGVGSIGLAEGRYVLGASARISGGVTAETTAALLVVKAGRPPLPLVVVVRTAYVPQRDPSSSFVIDPAVETVARQQTEEAAQLAALRPDFRIALALPPIMLEEWADAANGYSYVSAAGVNQVSADSVSARDYAAALGTVRESVANGASLVRVPYADPDLSGLQQVDGMADLGRQLGNAATSYRTILDATPSTGTAVLGNSVPASAAPELRAAGVTHFLVAPSSARLAGKPAPGGVYRASDTSMSAIVIDPELAAALSDPKAPPDVLLSVLFDRATRKGIVRPAVAIIEVGAGTPATVSELQARLARLARVEWVKFTGVSALAAWPRAGRITLARVATPGRAAPAGYWAEVATAREHVLSLRAAAGVRDPSAVGALHTLSIAESREWAGPDQSWALADRGRAYASAADRTAMDTFAKVGLSLPNVTLSGSGGKVPVSITNRTDSDLRLEVIASSTDLRRPRYHRTVITAKPGENILSVPVDLGSQFSGHLRVRLAARSTTIADQSSAVHASYMDRIALIVMVVLVLLGLLWYIRAKTRSSRSRSLDELDELDEGADNASETSEPAEAAPGDEEQRETGALE